MIGHGHDRAKLTLARPGGPAALLGAMFGRRNDPGESEP